MICSFTANGGPWRGSADAGTSRTAVSGWDEAPTCRRTKVSALCSAPLQSTVRVEQKGADIQPKMAATAFHTSSHTSVPLNCNDKIWYLICILSNCSEHIIFESEFEREKYIGQDVHTDEDISRYRQCAAIAVDRRKCP
jgi:hypothetical protein